MIKFFPGEFEVQFSGARTDEEGHKKIPSQAILIESS
jgi:hypothetical protein